MKCFNHNRKDAVGQCKDCGKGICPGCAVELENQLYCKKCISKKSNPSQKEAPKKEKPNIKEGNKKNPTLALLIGLILGLFGFAGIGQIYVGRAMRGIAMLIVGWVLLGINVLSSMLVITLCLTIPLSLIFIIWQAMDAMQLANEYNKKIEQTGVAPW